MRIDDTSGSTTIAGCRTLAGDFVITNLYVRPPALRGSAIDERR